MSSVPEDKKTVELSAEQKAKYNAASVDVLLNEATKLKSEADNPTLSTSQHVGSFLSGAFTSPESLVGEVAGHVIGHKVAHHMMIVNPLKTEAEGSKAALKKLTGFTTLFKDSAEMEKKFEKGVEEGLIKNVTHGDFHIRQAGSMAIGLATGVTLGAVLGLNAYSRYNRQKREDITQEKNAELSYVEKLLAERQAAAQSKTH